MSAELAVTVRLRLLTTLDVLSAKEAAAVVGFQLWRWRNKVFFRVLLSRFRTEFLPFRTGWAMQ